MLLDLICVTSEIFVLLNHNVFFAFSPSDLEKRGGLLLNIYGARINGF